MKDKHENYMAYLVAGLALTVVLILALGIYWIGQPNRLSNISQQFSVERISSGQEIYNQQCVACHGGTGEGGVGPALNSKTLLQNTLDEVFFSVIRSGVPNTQMPAWSVNYGGPLTDEDVLNVVAFIRNWEPNAPLIQPVTLEPSPARGALLFNSTCAICHGENGLGGKNAPAINDPTRLASLDNDWYRSTIRNGRPAKGMPTWGTVLAPSQIDDLIALIVTWREGEAVTTPYNATDEIAGAIFSIQQEDYASASLRVTNALSVTSGAGAEVLSNAQVQLDAGDNAGALQTLTALAAQWPLGDAAAGGEVYAQKCAPCHGANGEGGIGFPLHPSPFVGSTTNADLVQFILTGRPGTAMAGFKDRLTGEETANVVAFLRGWNPAP